VSAFYCERCYNTGELDCYCGGDLCVCENYGTFPCPDCEGGECPDDEYPDYDPPEGPPHATRKPQP
jgi:hypothetical protein